ncbi:MAG: hypothetical protein KAK01_02195 [Candidatus Marinimicrobia bacterium]|nr:hypothetical protein [Candidatus Neomarinimicrobiota bacterium]
MDRYQFEDLISEYIEGELSQSKRREFENYLDDHDECIAQVESLRTLLLSLHQLSLRPASADFMPKLLKRIEAEKARKNRGRISGKKLPNTILGFTPAYAGLMGAVLLAIVMVAIQLIPDRPGVITPSRVIARNTIEPVEALPVLETKSDLAQNEDSTIDSTEVPKTLPEHDFPSGMILVKDQE